MKNLFSVIIVSLLSAVVCQLPFDIQPVQPLEDTIEEEKVRVADNIKITTPSDNNQKLGGTLLKECSAEPKDDWILKWVLPDSREIRHEFLKLRNLKLSDAGRYLCVAFNRWSGRIERRSFYLDFEELYENVDIVSLPTEKFGYGGNVHRVCNALNYFWRTTWILPNGRNIHSKYLDIPKATRKRRGRYTCIATDPISGKKVSGWITLQFYRSHGLAVEISTTRNHKPQMGGTVGLKCHVSNHGKWSQRWITPTGVRIYNRVVTVRNLGESDLGRYICVAEEIETGHRHMFYYVLN